MILSTTRLRTGEQLVTRLLMPPLGEYADKVGVWASVRDELLGGQWSEWLSTPFYVAEIDGEVVGSMSCFTPADTQDVGIVEWVQTAEEHRQKGIASALLGQLVERFRARAGLALYLCTSNPFAGVLYEKHGFWYRDGQGMQYLAPDAQDFDETYLAFCGKARTRDATWGDMPRAAVLYNHPEPRWFSKDSLSKSFADSVFETHFLWLMKRTENRKGAFVVLVNPRKRVVGGAVLERVDTYYEQHVATLSFRVCPAYVEQTSELLKAAADRAKDLSINVLQLYIADRDNEHKELAKAAGFSEEARLRGRLRDGAEWMDLLVYSKSLSGAAPPQRGIGDYYGGRMAWQAERIASGRSVGRGGLSK
jgi:RimJ/RimL family protein N-acetyltransferase